MVRDEICVCGHPQSMHRTYGCNGSIPIQTRKKPTVSSTSAGRFKNAELLTVSSLLKYLILLGRKSSAD
jgi:hypothetical protein